jgi:predicted dienelactone hydrolase
VSATSRRLARIAVAIVVVGALAATALIAALAYERTHDVTLPDPSGPFAVGRTTDVWTDDSHVDPFGETPDAKRELVVWIWYPSTPPSTAEPAPYLPDAWRAAVDAQRPLPLKLLTRDPVRVHPHSSLDAPLSAAANRFPIVILRGGLGALTTDYTTLAEDLASHGYVVVGFDAPYRTTVVVFPDGRVVRRRRADNPETLTGDAQTRLAERLLAAWTSDVGFVADRLERMNATDGRFRGRLDLQALGVAGHSLGGATAAQFCHDDARCRAGIDIDGAPLGSVVRDSLQKPFMFLLSDHSRESDAANREIMANITSIYDRLPKNSRLLTTIPGANHFSFSDQMVVRSQMVMAVLQRIGGVRLEPRRGLAIAAEDIRRFFDVHLKGTMLG